MIQSYLESGVWARAKKEHAMQDRPLDAESDMDCLGREWDWDRSHCDRPDP